MGFEPMTTGATIQGSNRTELRPPCLSHLFMARPEGVEPPAYGLEVRCSILLSYRRRYIFSIWSGKRVSNPRQPAWKASALPTELFPLMVGVRGFEPPAPCSQSRCASQTALHPETKVLYSISL